LTSLGGVATIRRLIVLSPVGKSKVFRLRNMMTLSTGTPSEIKKVVSTTSCFQRSEADILQVSDHQAQKFLLYEQLSAESGLVAASRSHSACGFIFISPRDESRGYCRISPSGALD
jgi:hypothetical protein